jgi:hypothetical protein
VPITTVEEARMPNQPKTPGFNVRIPLDVKAAAQAKAKAENRTLSDVIVAYLTRYGRKRN